MSFENTLNPTYAAYNAVAARYGNEAALVWLRRIAAYERIEDRTPAGA